MKLIEDFNGMPSLEFSTAAQVVITIWNRDDMVRSVSRYLDMQIYRNDLGWNDIAQQVRTIVRGIPDISSTLKRNMDALIIPIGHHIIEAKAFLNLSPYIVSAEMEFPVSHWTYYGTVDTKRLEEILMRDSTKNIIFRFTLACNDCVETVVEELFPLLPNEHRYGYLQFRRNKELLSYWVCRLLRISTHFKYLISTHVVSEGEDDYSADQIAFKYTLMRGSKSGIEYFLNYLRPHDSEIVSQKYVFAMSTYAVIERRMTALIAQRPREQFADALYFLLSKLSENLRNRLLRHYRGYIWRVFLYYPFYGLFCEHANDYMDIYTEEDIFLLIRNILKLKSVDTNFLEYEPFYSLWDNCSQAQKNYVNTQRNELIRFGGEVLVNILDALILPRRN